jgi:hypothetical protein
LVDRQGANQPYADCLSNLLGRIRPLSYDNSSNLRLVEVRREALSKLACMMRGRDGWPYHDRNSIGAAKQLGWRAVADASTVGQDVVRLLLVRQLLEGVGHRGPRTDYGIPLRRATNPGQE